MKLVLLLLYSTSATLTGKRSRDSLTSEDASPVQAPSAKSLQFESAHSAKYIHKRVIGMLPIVSYSFLAEAQKLLELILVSDERSASTYFSLIKSAMPNTRLTDHQS